MTAIIELRKKLSVGSDRSGLGMDILALIVVVGLSRHQ